MGRRITFDIDEFRRVLAPRIKSDADEEIDDDRALSLLAQRAWFPLDATPSTMVQLRLFNKVFDILEEMVASGPAGGEDGKITVELEDEPYNAWLGTFQKCNQLPALYGRQLAYIEDRLKAARSVKLTARPARKPNKGKRGAAKTGEVEETEGK